MKRKLFLLVNICLVMLILHNVVSADPEVESITNDTYEEPFKFRGYEWGTPLETIRNDEITDGMINGEDYYTEETRHMFFVVATVTNLSAVAIYEFDNDWLLINGYYVPDTDNRTQLDCFTNYLNIRTGLITVYGEPTLAMYMGFETTFAEIQPEKAIANIVNNAANTIEVWMANDLTGIVLRCFVQDEVINTTLLYSQDAVAALNNLAESATNGL